MNQTQNEAKLPMPPGTDVVLNITCKDVVMGRGSGTQNHCGNVTYRKLVFLNKELYVTSSKFDKLKISKAIVAAIRTFGGRFLQVEGNGHLDIGDKRAWDKTSQALREGQTEVRARLAAEGQEASGAQKVAEYKQVITEQTFLAYACKILQSLYDPFSGSSTSCGPNCPHAKRRATMNRTDAMAIQHAMYTQEGNAFVQQQVLNQQRYIDHTTQDANYEMATGNDHVSPKKFNGKPVVHYSQAPPPIPQVGISSLVEDTLKPIPYNMPCHQPFEFIQQPQRTKITSGDDALARNRHTLDSVETFGTDVLRKLLENSIDMDSNEMSQQLNEMIRRKSHGLVRIDAVEAFEDLVFEEDNAELANLEFPEPQVSNGTNSTFSGLSGRGESLMNMSLLTIEDRDGASPLETVDGPSQSLHQSLSRVRFTPENVSSMSLEIGSLRDLAYDPNENEPTQQAVDSDKTSAVAQGSISPLSQSRAMGFPIRKSILKQQQAGVSTVIPSEGYNTRTSTLSDASALTDAEFSEMAKNVAPPTSDISLKIENMSFSNMSMMSVVDESILSEDKKRC